MKKYKFIVGVLLIFCLIFQATVVVAEDIDKLVKEATSNLKAAQNALKEGNQDKVYSLLSKVESKITKAKFPMMPKRTDEKILVNDFVIRPAEDFFEFKEAPFSSNSFSLSVRFLIENLTNKKRDVSWDYYLINPSGIQRSGNVYGEFHVLGGVKVRQSFNFDIKKERFEFGTYTFRLLPKGANKKYTFKLQLTEDKLQ